jgi:hypothetical protein
LLSGDYLLGVIVPVHGTNAGRRGLLVGMRMLWVDLNIFMWDNNEGVKKKHQF